MKIQIVFYSMYGHIYRMAEAVAEGARGVEGAEVSLFQVAELVSPEALARTGADKARQAFAHIPLAEVDRLAEAGPSSSAPPPASATCAPRCGTSWIRPAASGPRGD